MLRYLVERGEEYVIEAVRYQGGYRHVFAFRRSLPEAEAIRRQVILLQIPVVNPDGLDLISHWYRGNVGTPGGIHNSVGGRPHYR